MSVPWEHWAVLREKDETDTRIDYAGLLRRARPDLERELTPAVWRARSEACQRAIGALGERLRAARPDVIVVLGDDQHEQFLDENLPVVAVYNGESLSLERGKDRGMPAWKVAEEQRWAKTAAEYPAAPALADHLIRALVDDEFDVARCNRLREGVGIGHAFAFLYRRLWADDPPPIVPVMLNTYYPPNQPTPKRCYTLGRALRRAIEGWDRDARVAVMASGGLSHVVMDEELDRQTIAAMQGKDRDTLCALPRERLRGGTSEILNWVAVAGAMEAEPMTVLDYVPAYRSPAGTGCGAGFAYWE
jgi:aromatic ring-opening dioxygenase catalytic subunit (LigB family)